MATAFHALFQSRAPSGLFAPIAPYSSATMRTASGGKVAHAVVPGSSAEALDLLGRALDDDLADAQAHAVALGRQAVHGARQAVEPVAGRLQRDADLPRVDGDADAAGGRLGRAHDPAGVERDLDAAVAAARAAGCRR